MSETTKTSRAKEEKLVSYLLGEFGMLDPDELDKLIMSTARRFVDDPLAPTEPTKSMTEAEVRAKFGDMFQDAYELLANNDKHDLIMMELETFARHEKDFMGLLKEIKDLHEENCKHEQLYAHVTIKVVLPIKRNSAAEMTGVLSRIKMVLGDTELSTYYVESGIEVDEDARP